MANNYCFGAITHTITCGLIGTLLGERSLQFTTGEP
jgi:hypothetical protein